MADLRTSPDSYVTGLAFSPDNRLVAVGTSAGTLHIWNVDPDAVARRICQAVGTSITREEWTRYFPSIPYRPPCP